MKTSHYSALQLDGGFSMGYSKEDIRSVEGKIFPKRNVCNKTCMSTIILLLICILISIIPMSTYIYLIFVGTSISTIGILMYSHCRCY